MKQRIQHNTVFIMPLLMMTMMTMTVLVSGDEGADG